MSALVVCGKRSSSVFEEQILLASPPASKRSRCGPRLSPPSSPSDLPVGGSNFAYLRTLFPSMDPQIIERILEESGDYLDSAIKRLNSLHLESADANIASPLLPTENGLPSNIPLGISPSDCESVNGIPKAICLDGQGVSNPPPADNSNPTGSEWVELFVTEMMSASDIDDARARASRALAVLEKSILAHAGHEALKENTILKEQLEALIRENAILKRAVAIQHERQKEFDEKNQELQNLKQLVSQYQEQVRTLEINNYALTMHLRQAQQGSSIPGHFHPDVF